MREFAFPEVNITNLADLVDTLWGTATRTSVRDALVSLLFRELSFGNMLSLVLASPDTFGAYVAKHGAVLACVPCHASHDATKNKWHERMTAALQQTLQTHELATFWVTLRECIQRACGLDVAAVCSSVVASMGGSASLVGVNIVDNNRAVRDALRCFVVAFLQTNRPVLFGELVNAILASDEVLKLYHDSPDHTMDIIRDVARSNNLQHQYAQFAAFAIVGEATAELDAIESRKPPSRLDDSLTLTDSGRHAEPAHSPWDAVSSNINGDGIYTGAGNSSPWSSDASTVTEPLFDFPPSLLSYPSKHNRRQSDSFWEAFSGDNNVLLPPMDQVLDAY